MEKKKMRDELMSEIIKLEWDMLFSCFECGRPGLLPDAARHLQNHAEEPGRHMVR